MPRKRAEVSLQALYEGMPSSTVALEAQAADTRERLLASTRPDAAGATINTMIVPQSYQQRVMSVWNAYGTDPLFARLINRACEFAANGSTWEVGSDSDGSWLSRLKNWATKDERQEEFWNLWSDQINYGVPNVLPGLNEVVRWACKHMLLSGMFVPHWELGTMRFGKQDFIVPKRITCYPASAVTLARGAGLFMEEDIFLLQPKTGMTNSMFEGQFSEAQQFIPRGMQRPANMEALKPMTKPISDGENWVGQTEAFALKYNWTPGDIVGIRRGQTQFVGAGIYPLPPFYQLLPQFLMRQKLFASDLALLDGVINYILMYKIGDKDFPPKPPIKNSSGAVVEEGTIATVKRLIQENGGRPAMELFVPYYVDLVVKMPDTAVLLSDTKYGASATEIMQAFGILAPRTQAGARVAMEKMNTAGFEEFVGAIRQQIGAFLDLLANHVIEINRPKLDKVPTWSPNPLNTKTEAFIQELYKLAQIGRISMRSLLRYHGLNDKVEVRRIAQELATDTDDLANENVPLSYVQQTVQDDTGGKGGKSTPGAAPSAPGGKKPPTVPGKGRTRTTTAIPPTKQPGRPTK